MSKLSLPVKKKKSQLHKLAVECDISLSQESKCWLFWSDAAQGHSGIVSGGAGSPWNADRSSLLY